MLCRGRELSPVFGSLNDIGDIFPDTAEMYKDSAWLPVGGNKIGYETTRALQRLSTPAPAVAAAVSISGPQCTPTGKKLPCRLKSEHAAVPWASALNFKGGVMALCCTPPQADGETELATVEAFAIMEEPMALQIIGPDSRSRQRGDERREHASKDSKKSEGSKEPLAESDHQALLRRCGLDEEPVRDQTLRVAFELVLGLRDRGALREAEALCNRLLQLQDKHAGPDSIESSRSAMVLASICEGQGRFSRAEELYRRALVGLEDELGSDHADTLKCVNNVARLLEARGKLQSAEKLAWMILHSFERMLGSDHPSTGKCVNNLASVLEGQQKWEEAERLYRRAAGIFKRSLGPSHQLTVSSIHCFANALEARGQVKEAVPLYREVMAICEAQLGPEHPDTLGSMYSLASALWASGSTTEAEALFRCEIARCERKYGRDHPSFKGSIQTLARLFQDDGNFAAGEVLLQQILPHTTEARRERPPRKRRQCFL
mmetsp:Transcript_27797/g.54616  ORF Transcript_27797/g.54616 Transcript_27797/m.54616 type:complete len:490 (+) Transcript_27797:24-1493(+)